MCSGWQKGKGGQMKVRTYMDENQTAQLEALAADERARRDEARSRQARINARGRVEALARMVEQKANKPAQENAQ
jgi:hypothetical protein